MKFRRPKSFAFLLELNTKAKSLKTRHKVRWVSSRADEATVNLHQWFHIAEALHVQKVSVPDSVCGVLSEQQFRSDLAGLMWYTDFAASAAFVADVNDIWKTLQLVLGCSDCTYADLHHASS